MRTDVWRLAMVWLDSMACWAMDILNSRVLSDGLRLSVEALCA